MIENYTGVILFIIAPLREDRHLELRTLNNRRSYELRSVYSHLSFIRAIFFSMADR
jgi:hypothetical protein